MHFVLNCVCIFLCFVNPVLRLDLLGNCREEEAPGEGGPIGKQGEQGEQGEERQGREQGPRSS